MVVSLIEQKIKNNDPISFRNMLKKSIYLGQEILVNEKEVEHNPEVDKIKKQLQPYLEKKNNSNSSQNNINNIEKKSGKFRS